MIEIRNELKVFLLLLIIGITVNKPSVRLMLPYLPFLHWTFLLSDKRPTSSCSPYPFHTLEPYSAENINLSIDGSLNGFSGNQQIPVCYMLY